MLEYVNWVQQNEEYATRYHVLEWKTSHFHEPYSRHVSAGAKLNQNAAAALQAKEIQTETEGLGFGQPDRADSGRLRLGLGLEESLANAAAGAHRGCDDVNISAYGARVQKVGAEAVQTAVQSAALSQMHAAEHTVTPAPVNDTLRESQHRKQADRENTTVAGTGRGSIRNRLRESAARLREAYQRQREKAAKKTAVRHSKLQKEEKRIQKGTRTADREAVLAMQAENHYLLDSYDQKGNYSMLGKR